MRAKILGLALAALLIGCGQVTSTEEKAQGEAAATYAMAPAEAPAPMAQDAMRAQSQISDVPSDGAPPPPPAGGENGAPASDQPAPVLYLAYSYQIGMELPTDKLSGVMDAHVKACQDAGPAKCQLIGASRSGDVDAYLSGFVNLRAEPSWLKGFMAGVTAQVEAADGRITQQTTNTEDLTRAIIDTEANLRAKTTLRDRLQRLLASRPGRLSDLLDVERELARVQAEIDSTQSNLAVMRTRVAMSELTLNYQSSPKSIRSDTFEPLRNSAAGFLGWIVQGFAAIIELTGRLLPFLLVLGVIGWGVLRWRKNRKAKAAPAAPPVTVRIDEPEPKQ